VIYNLKNGHRVITRNTERAKEFETQNAEGETISTVRLGYLDANRLLRDLLKVAI
jgi:hypothetical protein